jgi:gamma-glutamyltranspeptidase/glutathione hydrolase/leukotriene-C4 hydrolase
MSSDIKAKKSRRWITTVGGAGAVIIVSLTVGIVIWQTHGKSEKSNSPPEVGYGEYQNAAVSCDAPLCSEIGKSMLQRGGSVVDAGIAALLCMGVINSQSMGVGGGFLAVFYNATEKKSYVLNARERAPAAAHQDMFKGNPEAAATGGLAVAVPGEIMGYWELHQKAGKLNWSDLFQPTIKICNEGFLVTNHTAGALNSTSALIKKAPSMSEIFVNNKTGEVFKLGDTLYRKKLAETFQRIAKNGVNEFYTGETAKMLVEDLQELGGIMTEDDLKNYTADWLEPLMMEISGGNYTLHAVPPPGSGVLMAFMMKVLDGYLLNPSSFRTRQESVVTYQRITEAFKHAYAKRTELGDPFDEEVREIVERLVSNLTSDSYVEDIRTKIQDDQTNNTYEYYGAEFYQPDDHGTSHISVIGSNGDALAITSTVNLYFGARIRSVRTGIIYNDEMDDFSAPNITNSFGVPPSPNNFIRPRKRPLSSMTPAIFTDREGNVRLALGTAGGTKITTSTTWVAMRNIWFEENIKDAIDFPRLHHQLYPMTLQVEQGFSTDLVDGLKEIGHETQMLSIAGSVTCGIARYSNGTIIANSDYRKGGTVAGY